MDTMYDHKNITQAVVCYALGMLEREGAMENQMTLNHFFFFRKRT